MDHHWKNSNIPALQIGMATWTLKQDCKHWSTELPILKAKQLPASCIRKEDLAEGCSVLLPPPTNPFLGCFPNGFLPAWNVICSILSYDCKGELAGVNIKPPASTQRSPAILVPWFKFTNRSIVMKHKLAHVTQGFNLIASFENLTCPPSVSR